MKNVGNILLYNIYYDFNAWDLSFPESWMQHLLIDGCSQWWYMDGMLTLHTVFCAWMGMLIVHTRLNWWVNWACFGNVVPILRWEGCEQTMSVCFSCLESLQWEQCVLTDMSCLLCLSLADMVMECNIRPCSQRILPWFALAGLTFQIQCISQHVYFQNTNFMNGKWMEWIFLPLLIMLITCKCIHCVCECMRMHTCTQVHTVTLVVRWRYIKWDTFINSN